MTSLSKSLAGHSAMLFKIGGTNAPPPVMASFRADVTSGPIPLTVTFTDNSTGGITNRFWGFGDGSTLNTAVSPVQHTYNALGTYTVTLTVSGSDGTSVLGMTNYIATSYAPPSLWAWLTFNNTLADAAGNGHTGMFVGNAGYSSDVPNATGGSASLNLPDNSSSVLVSNPGDLDMNTGHPFTLACWFAGIINSGSWPVLIIKQPASNWVCTSNNRAVLEISPDGHLYYGVACVGAVESTATVTDGLWHHGVIVYDGASYQLYVDGVADGSGTFAGCNEGAQGEPAWTFNVGYGLVGNVDEVAFWNEALTAIQVHQVYANGAGASLGTMTPFQMWQLEYFGCTNCPQAAPEADPLGKGMSNTNQFLAGLNPTNPASLFRILSIEPTGSDLNVTWQAGGGRTNTLQAANGLGLNFTDVGGLIILPGTGDIITNQVDPGGMTNASSRFYRVRLVP
jgi:PKD repeat protein